MNKPIAKYFRVEEANVLIQELDDKFRLYGLQKLDEFQIQLLEINSDLSDFLSKDSVLKTEKKSLLLKGELEKVKKRLLLAVDEHFKRIRTGYLAKEFYESLNEDLSESHPENKSEIQSGIQNERIVKKYWLLNENEQKSIRVETNKSCFKSYEFDSFRKKVALTESLIGFQIQKLFHKFLGLGLKSFQNRSYERDINFNHWVWRRWFISNEEVFQNYWFELVGLWVERVEGFYNKLWELVIDGEIQTQWLREFDVESLKEKFQNELAQKQKKLKAEFLRLNLIHFNAKALESRHQKQAQRSIKRRNALKLSWSKYFENYQKEIDLENDLTLLVYTLKENQQALEQRVESQVKKKFFEFLEGYQGELKQQTEKLNSVGQLSRAEWRLMLSGQRSEIEKEWINFKIPKLIDDLSDFNSVVVLDQWNKKFISHLDNLKTDYLTVNNPEVIKGRIDFDVQSFPLRSIAHTRLSTLFNKVLKEKSVEISEVYFEFIRNINNLGQLSISAFETTLYMQRKMMAQVGEVDPQRLQQTLSEGLERCQENALSTQEKFEEFLTLFESLIEQIVAGLKIELRQLGDREHLLALKLSAQKTKATSELKTVYSSFSKNLNAQYQKGLEKYKPIVKAISNWVLNKKSWIFSKTRLTLKVENDRQALLSYLRKTSNAVEELPIVYQRLFRFEPANDLRYLVQGVSETERMEKALQGWQKNAQGLVAIHGEKGCGKTTLIELWVKELFSEYSVKRKFPQRSVQNDKDLLEFISNLVDSKEARSIEEIKNEILQREQLSIIIIEDLQKLFLKSIEGLETFEKLLLFLAETQSKIFWVISCAEYSWKYLARVLNLNRFFGAVISIEGFNEEELKFAILERHQLSGIPLEFIPDLKTAESKSFKKLDYDQSQEFLEDKFFRELTQFSSGNISVALLAWLTSIKNVKGSTFQIQVGIQFDEGLLIQLEDQELFTLACIVQHETLDSNELSLAFQIEEFQAQLVLKSLFTKGLVVDKSDGYELHYFLYRPIVKLLKEKRMMSGA